MSRAASAASNALFVGDASMHVVFAINLVVLLVGIGIVAWTLGVVLGKLADPFDIEDRL